MKFFSLNSRRLPKRSLLIAAIVLLLLSFLSSYYFRIQPSIGYEEKQLEYYLHQQQKDFNQLLSDSVLIKKLVQQTETIEDFERVAEKEYGVFLFVETLSSPYELLFWNNQKILPPQADFNLRDGEYFQKLPNGYYLIVKKTIQLKDLSNNVICYALIPVFHEYSLPTEYLKDHFVYSNNAVNKITISDKKTPYVINSLSGKTLFHISRKAHTSVLANDPISAVIRVMAFILILVYVHFFAESVTRKKGIERGITILILTLIFIRALLYVFPDIFYFRQFQLFNDLTIYSTNWFNRSLGDLLLNLIFFSWIVVFTWFHVGPIKKLHPSLHSKKNLLIAGSVALFFLILSTFEFANVVRSLVKDSKISFAVTEFFSLNIYTVIGFVALALLSLSYYYFSRLLYRFIFPAFKENPLYVYFGIALIGLFYLTLRSGNDIVLFHIPVLIWLVVYTLLVSQEQFIINRFKITIAGMLFWIFVFSVSLAAILLKENQEKEIRNRRIIAEKHDQLTDPARVALRTALTYLDNDFFINNFDRLNSKPDNDLIRDSINQENLSSNSNYNIRLFIFDSSNRGINNPEPLSYAELENIYSVQSKPSEFSELMYHEQSYNEFFYITKREIRDTISLVGNVFILSTPKDYNNTDALYPQLFKQVNPNQLENSPTYSYAIYDNGLLTRSSEKYSFPITLTREQVPLGEFKQVTNGIYDELWYKPSNNKVVVIVKKRDTLLESITLFSYLFCAFLVLVALIQLLSIILKSAYDLKALNVFRDLNIRSQVHSTIIFISILSFLIIGTATISFFINRYKRNNIDKLSRTASVMVSEMKKALTDSENSGNEIQTYDSLGSGDLQRIVDEISRVHYVDVNIYDLNGDLKVSSGAEVYRQGVLSTKIHPLAYYHLHRKRQVQYVQEENLYYLNYLSIYSAVRDEKGKVYAYLNIPYFSSQLDLKQEISNFLVTIINLNAFIFLIAGIIALFITNRITASFSIIGDKMKEIRLGKTNEEIVWNRNDEIGELVKQYNKMVEQLEQSAEALAKSEREGAWREMARQVAHEIKNPLTPMKLSIQYLQKAVNNNQPNVKELTANVANTLVEQIDHLSKIAADFARFANIGNRNIEMFDLHHIIESLKDLYVTNQNVKIKWNRVEGSLVVKGDKTHMNRLFTNLLTNAVDACTEKQICKIVIDEERKDETVLIKITDNGEGIPEEIQSKMFTPNFTTKTSGTGLGLAMCKSIVEQAQGNIWFETTPGKGTTFFVELPIIS